MKANNVFTMNLGPGLRLAQPGCPKDRLLPPPPLPEDESIIQLPKSFLSLIYNLDDGQRPKEQFYILQRTIVRNLPTSRFNIN
jgi:hypothetical protein